MWVAALDLLLARMHDKNLPLAKVAAISGSGPAYVFHLVEALAQAGAALGLPQDLALRLARATVEEEVA